MRYAEYIRMTPDAMDAWYEYNEVLATFGKKPVPSTEFRAGYNAALHDLAKMISKTKKSYIDHERS